MNEREHLYDKLQQLQESKMYPFHMPGHKRNVEKLPHWNPYAMDITEIDGFDNLHSAEELLKEIMEEIAAFRGAEESFLLINGTTSGLLSGISACVKHGEEILVARNCHKAVYNAIYINELTPHYSYPPVLHFLGMNGGVSVDEIEKMLITFPKTKLIVVTSPTYEGVVSDIPGIVKVAHAKGIPVMVDQAHGAHFGMGEKLPQSAVAQGADLVVESVHKTLPAFTQTALLYVQGELVDRSRLKKYLGIYQTSSPSYPLMAGIEWCMEYCRKEQKKEFVRYEERLHRLRHRIERLEMIELFDGEKMEKEFGCVAYDPGKLVFGVKEQLLTGMEIYEKLRDRYQLQMEMASVYYCIAMTSVMDTSEGFQRLYTALEDINQIAVSRKRKKEGAKKGKVEKIVAPEPNEVVFSPYEAEQKKGQRMDFAKAAGKISKEYIYLYPPGIPVIVPGEKIHEKNIAYIKTCQSMGLRVMGLQEHTIEVID